MKKITILSLLIAVLFTNCKKADLADNKATGEGLVGFTLKDPSSGTNLVLNAATPDVQVDINWNASKPGLQTLPVYTWVAVQKTAENFDAPLLEIPSNNGGKDTKLTLTYKQIDDALKAKGVAEGGKAELKWTIRADNGSVKILAQNDYNITITRFKDGASPFVLLSPVSSLSPAAIDPGSETQMFTFRWSKSLPAAGGMPVTYKVLFVERQVDVAGNEIAPDFQNPLFTLSTGVPGDTLATITYKALSDSLNARGLTNLSLASELKWTVIATSGTWMQQADYINDLSVLREVRMYLAGNFQMAGGYGSDWTPATGPELIRDLRAGLANVMYYTYIYLPANAEFKVTQGRSWDVNYGGSSGDLVSGGNNLTVSAAGVYRISVNRTTLKYDISQGRMGFVGSATTSGWDPPSVFPNAAMGFPATDLFVGIHDFVPGGWKLIDNNQWNNGSNSVDETRSYGTGNPSGSALETNGGNFADITTAGAYRVIWDGRDPNKVTYQMSPASEMRVVGDGLKEYPAWEPAKSPKMTYQGKGVWKATLALLGGKEIKFLAGNDWSAFDYEDNGDGGSNAGGIVRKLRWDGDKNFSCPATDGLYVITLNEYNQTVSIQPQ